MKPRPTAGSGLVQTPHPQKGQVLKASLLGVIFFVLTQTSISHFHVYTSARREPSLLLRGTDVTAVPARAPPPAALALSPDPAACSSPRRGLDSRETRDGGCAARSARRVLTVTPLRGPALPSILNILEFE